MNNLTDTAGGLWCALPSRRIAAGWPVLLQAALGDHGHSCQMLSSRKLPNQQSKCRVKSETVP
jgi:hypothetical protein